ncbi:MAG: RidA family protein [Planctomycetes bacterium]|nr:RidA family protein [Planctomycetota bacterium]
MSIQQKIAELGFTLPEAPAPVANYVPAIHVGNEVRTSGQIPMKDGVLLFHGSVPSQQSIEAATTAAQLCGLNAIAAAATAIGDLEKLQGVLQLRVYIASDAKFQAHSSIANGVSDLMVNIFGEAGRHTRVAMGSIGLPLGATVEVEAVFSTKE